MSALRPDWEQTAIWWSVYPLGACGAPIREQDTLGAHHRLRRLESWLDHVIELGCNGLALGPIWSSTSHGYDIVDHQRIDPRLGDDTDFDHLIEACHTRGIKVLLDGVFNHVSADHWAVRQALAEGMSSPGGRLLRADRTNLDGLARFEGHPGLVELDHSHAEVETYVVETMSQWLDHGADGWRLDAAYRVPMSFWSTVLARVRARHPQMMTMAEIIHGDYANLAAAGGFDSITQYELWKAIWSSVNDRNPHELAWTLARHDANHGRQLPWLFVGNHDVTRIASQVSLAGARVACAIIMTVAGTPSVYYGDEWGWTGIKEDRVGGDDAIRPALPATPEPPTGEAAATLRWTQLAIRLRRTHCWLATAKTTVVDCTHERVVWRSEDEQTRWIQTELQFRDDPSLTVTDADGVVFEI
ncbi:MAG: alpha-amylase [Propionibacteriaceae bacterium]|nr:alpha-amylase [Propionibacteriaceae bacterium]